MTFREIRDRLVAADRQALEDYTRIDNLYLGSTIQSLVSFNEHRRNLLAGTIMMILDELIEREGMDANPPSKYGCHCELEEDMEPDDCVIDRGDLTGCVHAKEHMRKEQCKYWRLIQQRIVK